MNEEPNLYGFFNEDSRLRQAHQPFSFADIEYIIQRVEDNLRDINFERNGSNTLGKAFLLTLVSAIICVPLLVTLSLPPMLSISITFLMCVIPVIPVLLHKDSFDMPEYTTIRQMAETIQSEENESNLNVIAEHIVRNITSEAVNSNEEERIEDGDQHSAALAVQ